MAWEFLYTLVVLAGNSFDFLFLVSVADLVRGEDDVTQPRD